MDDKKMADATRIVQAGMKVMYANETRSFLNQAVKSKESTPEALAMNVVGVIKILFDKSKRTLPPELIPIATTLLLYELASFMRDAGRDVSSEDVKKAVLVAMGMLKQVFSKVKMPQKGAQPAPAEAQAPQRPAAQPPAPQGGLIQQPQMMGA